MIQKLIINSAIKLIAKQFKLDKVLEYVEKPNDADKKIKKLEKRIKKLEKDCLKFEIGANK